MGSGDDRHETRREGAGWLFPIGHHLFRAQGVRMSQLVMRNIVGERVLGLPKEPGIDSRSPFKDIKVS
jgi:hypothetical protein